MTIWRDKLQQQPMAREYTHQQSKAEVFHQMPHRYLAGIEGVLCPFEIPATEYHVYLPNMKAERQQATEHFAITFSFITCLPSGWPYFS